MRCHQDRARHRAAEVTPSLAGAVIKNIWAGAVMQQVAQGQYVAICCPALHDGELD